MKKVYLNEIEEKSRELVNYSKNDIANQIEKLKSLSSSFIWEGIAKEKYLVGYNNKINQLAELNNNMRKISEFLLKVKEDYNSANNKINAAYEELLSELKIRGDN